MNNGGSETTAATRAGPDAPPSLIALGARQRWCRLWRHRHQPPLRFSRGAIAPSNGWTISARNVLGVLSLIVWALIMVVTLKYVLILLRADNNGEGGTLSLMALA